MMSQFLGLLIVCAAGFAGGATYHFFSRKRHLFHDWKWDEPYKWRGYVYGPEHVGLEVSKTEVTETRQDAKCSVCGKVKTQITMKG